MSKSLADDLEKILNALARIFAEEGKAPEVALLAHSKAKIQEKLNEPEDYDEWTVVTRGYTVYLESPFHLYVQVAGDREARANSEGEGHRTHPNVRQRVHRGVRD